MSDQAINAAEGSSAGAGLVLATLATGQFKTNEKARMQSQPAAAVR